MKPIASKRFYFTFHEKLYWSDAYQALTKSAVNLMMCLYAELRWSGKGKKRVYTNNGEISFSEAEFKANNAAVDVMNYPPRSKESKVDWNDIYQREGHKGFYVKAQPDVRIPINFDIWWEKY